jgi:hypothetical protein
MKKSLITLAAITAALFTSQAVLAQEAAPKKREDVKAETKAAVKAGEIAKGDATAAPAPAKSTKARAEVKKEAAAAEKAGTIDKGDVGTAPAAKSTKARAEVKKEAAESTKSQPKGEDVKK